MRSAVLGVALVLSVGLWSGLAADASSPCSGRGLVTVSQNASGRVMRTRRSGPDGPRTYGCLYRFDNRVPLEHSDADFGELVQPRSIRLAGWLTGYARDFLGGDGLADVGGTDIVVRSLHPRGRLKRRFNAEPDERRGPCDDDCDSRSMVSDMVLRGKGAVAWIVCPGSTVSTRKRRCFDGEPASVYKVGSTARNRVRVDHAAGIDIFSLRLLGSTLSWTRDGAAHRTTLR
jgi:hypothetical protein